MRMSSVIVVLALALGVVFALLNQEMVVEVRDVQLPGGTYTSPVVGSLLIISAIVLLLVWVTSWIQAGLQRRALNRALAKVAQREQQITEMKSRAYDDVSEKLDALRDEILARLPSSDPAREERTAAGPGVGGG